MLLSYLRSTLDHLDLITSRVAAAETLALRDCGHSPHRDQPDAVLSAAIPFIAAAESLGVGHVRSHPTVL
jgi:hypothetical protein